MNVDIDAKWPCAVYRNQKHHLLRGISSRRVKARLWVPGQAQKGRALPSPERVKLPRLTDATRFWVHGFVA